MVNKVRTLNFLPEVFRTPTNAQFLAASLDVLTSQPDLKRVEGFIGSKYGYGIEPQDKYVVEPTKARSDYQLDPSVVFLKKDTQTANDFINYPGIVAALANEGGITNNNDRLFENQFYSWDGFFDIDKTVNYSQYYWIPNGPDAVEVATTTVFLNKDYTVSQASGGFSISGNPSKNPTLTLLRGGTYTFEVNESGKFWIQGIPGVTGFDTQDNISTRDVLGVSNNGAATGTVTFTVPQQDAQQQYELPGNNLVDIVTSLAFNQIDGISTSVLTNIDGVTDLSGKTLIFYNNGDLSSQQNYYTISIVSGLYQLTATTPITNLEKITVTTGTVYANRNFYRESSGVIQLIPYLSAQLNTLYYQDGSDPLSVGVINLIESNDVNFINVDNIIGRTAYTSPNGVTLINGLKIVFRGNVSPSSYQGKEFYVAGVGTYITLLAVEDYLSVENESEGLYQDDDSVIKYIPVNPQYLTISRDSRDRNAWTRANRWFNKAVIDATISYNGTLSAITGNVATKAQRPIIEFYGNLSLWNSGNDFLTFVDLFDTTTTDALSTVVGQTSATVDGVLLQEDQLVVFSADDNLSTQKTVYQIKFVSPTGPEGIRVISLVPYTTVTADEQQVCVKLGDTQSATSWRFSGTTWIKSQQKNTQNQAPLFDIFDANQISIGNQDYYVGSTFVGTKLFSYAPGTGANDPVLGFPISYTSVTNIGDIQFTVNFNSDTFSYVSGTENVTQNINVGYVHYMPTIDTIIQRTGWVKSAAPSIQYQVFEFEASKDQTEFVCDVPAVESSATPWRNVQVYYNDVVLTTDEYSVTIDAASTKISLVVPALVDDAITVLVYSDSVSESAYYEIPANLQNNPFNTNITTIDVGGLQNQYNTIFTNAPGVTGQMFGPNNVYNLGNLNQYGTAVIQNSASLVLPGVFLRKPGLNVFDAIQYSSDEYITYKQQLVDLTGQNDFSIYQTPAEMLDTIIYQLSTTKNSTNSFFWGDMLFSGSPYAKNTYSFGAPTTTATFSLSNIWSPTWFEESNYNGLGIYVTTVINNISVTRQLLKNVDYVVSTTGPSVTVNYNIQAGDTVTVKEYNQTYGSYCPQTPTKLGLYDAFVPGVVLNSTYTTPTWFIQGHDGSYTKLYGTYNPVTEQLSDFRDQVLLEFESRVFNNLKVSGIIPLRADAVFPGQFRTTEYTRSELLEIYSTTFLNWVGKNRIDYKQQIFNLSNEFTYNYNQSSNRLDGEQIQQGYWRGIYNWLYDTNNPAAAPWEMLGFTQQPEWWDSHYGAAPYTSGNTLMWADIAAGYVWNNGDSYIEPLRVRPGLLSVLPVDAAGDLVSPFTSIVGNYDSLTFNRDWVIGDEGPAESSYLKSSSWPFDLMRILALAKPAKFFNLFVDRDLYKYNAAFDQYLYNDRYHLDARSVQVYGNGVSKASYINWVVDYLDQLGIDGTTMVSETLANIDVRLTYNLAGFSAKNYLQFLIEKSTPDTQNTSLLVPDESYQVLLYDNVPDDRIVYSSVVIQKTERGWAVYGNSQNKKYFTVALPKPGPGSNINVGTVTVKVSQDYYSNKTATIPYGTEFYSVQGVSEFINSYGRYLTDSGVLCNYMDNSILYDWTQMIREFVSWTQQGWEVGTTISLNPDAKLFTVMREGLVVQPLTIQQKNFILNQNLLPLQSQNTAITREGESFTVSVLSEGDTVAYTNLNLSSMEHAVVFDNLTAFNDTIYNPTSGLRQPRLKLKGYKTAEWNGFVDTSGFILSQDNIQEWQQNTKYAKGQIVTYKAKYWVANVLVQPAAEFFNEQWDEISADKIKTGLLPNPSTNAYESLYYYDSTRANLENDADLLSFSLIGYRPRQYLVDADLSDITQINVYKNIVTEKGTNLIANAFKEANLAQGQIDYKIKENWAIKNGVFGSVLNSNFVECLLDENALIGNPTIIGFSTGATLDDVQQTVPIADLINYERPPQTANFLPLYDGIYTDERGLPTAGYVNLNDVKFKAYSLLDLNDVSTNVSTLYRGDAIWIANHQSSWDVFTPVTLNTTLTTVVNNFDDTITLTYSSAHNLAKNDPIVVVNFDTSVDGYYTVLAVEGLTSITLEKALPTSVIKISGQGATFKLVSRRFEQASDIANNLIANSAFYKKLFWVDNDVDGQWAVWGNGPEYTGNTVPFDSNIENLGTSLAYSTSIGILAGDKNSGKIYRYYDSAVKETISVPGSSLGTKIVAVDDWAFSSSPTTGKVYVYKLVNNYLTLQQQISVSNTGAIAVSDDLNWLYIANTTGNAIDVYMLENNQYVYVNHQTTSYSGIGFGYSLACSNDGSRLIAGIPYADFNSVTDVGAAAAYSRVSQRFNATEGQVDFLLAQGTPSNKAIVYVDDVIVDATVSDGLVTLNAAATEGQIVQIDTGTINLMQVFRGAGVTTGANFGLSVDTNRYGADILIGAPNEVATVNNVPGVEGAVYKYTDAGQKYGTVLGTIDGSVNGYIYIDGFCVNFSGTIDQVVAQINQQTNNNILARYDDTTLIIGTNNNSVVLNNIVDVTGSYDELAKLGIVPYTKTQVIYNPDSIESSESQNGQLSTSRFGYSIAMNERDGVVIGAPTGSRRSETTFDFTDDLVDNDTIFDNGASTFVDVFADTGVVYQFDYLPASNESIDNPGQYVFGQYIQINETAGISLIPHFGAAVEYSNNVIFASAPSWYEDYSGRVEYFVSSVEPSSWYIDKQPLPMVNVNSLQDISIYSIANNETLEYLDYIDPQQGKMLGAVSTNLDYIGSKDPAIYGVGVEWSDRYVGKTWLDTTNLRMLNYNQPDVTYNASNWGKAFPGSLADVYTWISSPDLPVDYSGPGYVTDFNKYVEVTTYDRNTNSLRTIYFYWVKAFDQVTPGKTLSAITLSQYILDPQTSGISYMAAITSNVVALVNCADAIQIDSALHIGYQSGQSGDQIHTSWQLIATDDAQSFLPGIPESISENPQGLYLKYLDSFAGQDQIKTATFTGFNGTQITRQVGGNFVPDRTIPVLQRYGTSFNPNQSMFVDRINALKTYVQYVNDVLIKLPIVETRNLYFLNKVSSTYDTRNYWTYANWWADGYSDSTKINIEVATYTDLLRLVPSELITSNQGLVIALEDGLIARVKTNSIGKAETYVYTSANGWTRVGLENGTIQILNTIWSEAIGWASTNWSTGIWDKTLFVETYNIIRWINEQAFIDELLIERNNSLMLMFNLIQSDSLEQQNYLPWLTKTSLVDVSHRVRDLYPYKSYQRDNYEFLSGYLNEIKPYHVVFKDIKFTFDGLDAYPGNITDFDLPAQYNSSTGQFDSPQLIYQQTYEPNQYLPSNSIWTEQQYNQWFSNYGLSIAQPDSDSNGITTLVNYVAPESLNVTLASVYGIPESGTIIVDTETMTYESVDRLTGKLGGVTRTDSSLSHLPGASVVVILSAVVILDQARGYTSPPNVSAVIDTNVFPEPRAAASFTPSVVNGSIVAVTVDNSGSGYAVAPIIRIDGSDISETFSADDINLTFNIINIPAHEFVTGDPVVYTTGTGASAPSGLTDYEYYYVRSIDADNIALYNSYSDALDTEKYPLVDNRVKLGTAGAGVNTLTVTARAICFTSGSPIREVKTTIKFDRVSYTSKIVNWQSSAYYAGEYVDPINLSSSDLLVDSTAPWDVLRWDSFTAADQSQLPTAAKYRFGWDSDLMASQNGAQLIIEDVTSDVDGYVNLTLDYGMTTLAPGQLLGLTAVFYLVNDFASGSSTTYWLKAVSDTVVEVYSDPLYVTKVTYSSFTTYAANDIILINEPFNVQQSLVKYQNKLWRCVISNNDTTFDYDKWTQIYSSDPELTAADRILAFYDPTANMPGIDLSQLMDGVTYPNNTLMGPSFYTTPNDSTTIIDTNVTSPSFGDDIVEYEISGGLFTDGYGPEELVAGVVSDTLNLTVNTAPGSYWPDSLLTTGFNEVRLTGIVEIDPDTGEQYASFATAAENPAAILIYDEQTYTIRPIDQIRLIDGVNYTIDWVNKVITFITTVVDPTIVVCEFGGGRQVSRSNNSVYPLREVGDHSEIYLDVAYSDITLPVGPYDITASVLVNGQKIYYGVDYTLLPQTDSTNARIVFNQLYDASVDYITWVFVSGSNGYSIPETQTFSGIVAGTYDLDYYIGASNAENAIVELNGVRIYDEILVAEYTVSQTLAYGVTVNPQDPSFDINNIVVNVNGVDVPRSASTWTLNWDTDNIPAGISGLDAEFYYPGSVGGYIDSGVGIAPNQLYVVLDQSYAATIVGQPIRISYNGSSSVQPTYAINPTANTIEITVDIPLGTYLSVTTFNDTTQQDLVTEIFDISVATDEFQLNQPFDIDVNRIWVSVTPTLADAGGYINQANMQILPGNVLKFSQPLVPVTSSMQVIVTSMVPLATPNAMNFRINIDKLSQPTVYRQGNNTQTYLTENTSLSSDTIYVQDVLKLVATTETSGIVEISGYVLIQSEQIWFTTVDIDNNTLSGLTRGTNGTITNEVLYQYSQVQGILPQNLMDAEYYYTDWTDGLPLQIATTPAAKFLQFDNL